jgi:hypothetical protein
MKRAAIILPAAVFLLSCSGFLPSSPMDETAIAGRYNLILYAERSLGDLETIALLDVEGDGYEFVPYSPKFEYEVINGVSAEEAVREAKHWVSAHHAFHSLLVSEVAGPSGAAIGYEFRPLYMPIVFGMADVLDITYRLKEDGKVRVRVDLKREIEDALLRDGGVRGFLLFRTPLKP